MLCNFSAFAIKTDSLVLRKKLLSARNYTCANGIPDFHSSFSLEASEAAKYFVNESMNTQRSFYLVMVQYLLQLYILTATVP